MSKRGWAKKRIRPSRKKSDPQERLVPRPDRQDRPTPVQAIEWQHARQAQILAGRDDRYSQLLSRLLKDERQGQYVLTTSGLTEQDHRELDSLAPEAHAGLKIEMHGAIERLRGLLTVGDPLYIAAL